ncbi:cytochrome P450 [Nemania sp. FL0916]|nr:cytochrome P450 [Nemania sp. FL0916]
MGVFGAADHHVHRCRRASLNPLFSRSCATAAEGLIYDKLDLLTKHIDARITSQGHVDMRLAFLSLATDVVSEYCLGRSFRTLEDETIQKEWYGAIRGLAGGVPYLRQFSWLMTLSNKLPVFIMRMVSPGMANIAVAHHNLKLEALQAVTEHENGGKYSEVSPHPRERFAIFRAVLQHHGLPPHEKVYNRIYYEAVTMMAAGSETTASTLMVAFYFVIADKGDLLSRLRDEIKPLVTGVPKPSTIELERLPLLTAVIKEALRMTALTARLTRVAPEEALQYKNWVIPAGTPVGITLRDISFDPEIYRSPMEFRPERWLPGNPELDRCNRSFVGFGRGTRSCIGMNLANAELYIVLVKLFCYRDFELFNTIRERDVDFVRDFFIGETSPKGKGVRVTYASPSSQEPSEKRSR